MGRFTSPATNFYEIERDTLKTAENVAQVFMGIRTQCAQCHNHPFDRWTMNDYYGFASFFSQIGRKNAEDYREKVVYNRGGGETKSHRHKEAGPADILGWRVSRNKRKRPTRRSRRMADQSRKPVLFDQHRQPSLGALHGSWIGRPSGRHPCQQSA